MRRDISAVREGVDPCPFRHALPVCEVEQRLQVLEMRVDAALRDEAEQMHGAPALLRALERGHQRRVLEERSVADGGVHALQVLEEDPARPDRQVPDLGVAHLTGREADGLTGCGERRVWELAPEAVEDRRARQLDGVAGTGRSAAPAIENDERYEVDAAQTNRCEGIGVERGAADERAVDRGLGEELGRVFRLHRAAVEHRPVEQHP